jgi:hypothetical protein
MPTMGLRYTTASSRRNANLQWLNGKFRGFIKVDPPGTGTADIVRLGNAIMKLMATGDGSVRHEALDSVHKGSGERFLKDYFSLM